jgi:multimeric flavodoxin WrbA
MNIIAICGSPRKGNTEYTLKRFLTRAEELGHRVELVLLREKRIGYCAGCDICVKEKKPCPIVDDARIIMERMVVNDLIVFGSPNYFNNVSGMMKVFFDRLNPLYGDKKLAGKKAIAIFVGDEVNSIDKAIVPVRSITNSLELDMVGDLYLRGSGPQYIANDPESQKKIDEFAKNLLS